MKHSCVTICAVLALLLNALPATNALADDKLTPILPLADVRSGMKGYGLTVYHGTKIEAFPITVISVQRDFGPKRGVIWIECTDARMKEFGPVSGMSGSPIYLWADDEKPELGKGGKLIGAFAYGYNGQKICYAGVQPIEYMRDVATRVRGEADKPAADADAGSDAKRAGTAGTARLDETLASWLAAAREQKVSDRATWRMRVMAEALKVDLDKADSAAAKGRTWTAPDGERVALEPMALPLMVRSEAAARHLRPLLASSGLIPIAGGAAGTPPPGIDADAIELAPGSVLSIPLAYGDLDLAGVGTTTEVLPDGRVLGFGHAMLGEGQANLPLATGYVHMVIATYGGSFKLGGSAAIKGTISRDENAAVAGSPGGKAPAAELTVVIRMPAHPERTYTYHVVENRYYAAMITALLTIESLFAEQGLPAEATLRLRGSMVFEGDRTHKFDNVLAGDSFFDLMSFIAMPVAMMMQNPYQQVGLRSGRIELDVEPTDRSALITEARLEKTAVAPGGELVAHVTLQGYRRAETTHRLVIPIPKTMADGEYQVVLCGADRYSRYLFTSKAHLLETENVDQLLEMLQLLANVRNDRLFAVIPLPEGKLTVGRSALPQLPSGHQAMINAPSHTLTGAAGRILDRAYPTTLTPQGELSFGFTVNHRLADR